MICPQKSNPEAATSADTMAGCNARAAAVVLADMDSRHAISASRKSPKESTTRRTIKEIQSREGLTMSTDRHDKRWRRAAMMIHRYREWLRMLVRHHGYSWERANEIAHERTGITPAALDAARRITGKE